MLEKGVYLPPSSYETCFISAAHTDEDLDKTLDAFKSSI
jgi:glutamate-1-semialdehyde 2,1-aminomutase